MGLGSIRKLFDKGLVAILALLGPMAVAGAHFLVSATLIPNVPAADFGAFAFAMVVLQLGTGLSDGLLGSPMAAGKNDSAHVFRVFSFANFLYCLILLLFSTCIMLYFLDLHESIIFSIFITIMTFRWFGRSFLFTIKSPTNANLSDVVYSFSLSFFVLILFLSDNVNLLNLLIFMLLSSIISIVFLGREFYRLQLRSFRPDLWRGYATIWQTQARWSILGVLANAATIESHVFVVSFLAGPEAFAPIAVAALFFRPTLIAMYALSQVERPKIAQSIRSGGAVEGKKGSNGLLWMVVGIWFANAVLAAICAVWTLNVIVDADYDIAVVKTCIILLALIMLVRCIRQPLIVFLQASNQFRAIAAVTFRMAPTSLMFAAAGLWWAGAAGSLAGLLIADALFLGAIASRFRRTDDSVDFQRRVSGQ